MTVNKLLKRYTLLYIFFATECMGFYGWLKMPFYSVTFAHVCCLGITILFFPVIIANDGYRLSYNKKDHFFVLVLFLISIIEIGVTRKIAKSQNIILILAEAFPYMAVLIEMYVWGRLISNKKELEWLEVFLEKVSLVLNIMAIIQFVTYPVFIFLPIERLLFRNGLPRIYVGGEAVGIIGLLISLNSILQKRGRSRAYWNMFAIFIVRFIVTQGRSSTLIYIAIILIGIINTYKPLKYVKSLIYLALSIIIIGIFLSGDIRQISNQVYNADFSFMVRFDGISFFWKKFLEYPVWGMGFITSSGNVDSLSYSLLSNGGGYRYNRSDVGIFGLLNMFGLTGITWFTFLMNDIRKKGKIIYNRTKDSFGIIAFYYLLLSAVNLIVTDFQRIGLLPMLLIIINKRYIFSEKRMK